MKKTTIYRLLITLFLASILYYFFLPPINLTAPDFWMFVVMVFIIYVMTSILDIKELPNTVKKNI